METCALLHHLMNSDFSAYKQRCINAIDEAIEEKRKVAILRLIWISPEMAAAGADAILSFLFFAPSPSRGQRWLGLKLSEIYTELQNYYEDDGIGLHFSGCEEGSLVEIEYKTAE